MKTIAATFCIMASSVTAGPFGIDVDGFLPEKYACQKVSGARYKCHDVPEPHPAFEAYAVRYYSEVGLCMIKGIGKNLEPNRYGSSIEAQVDEIYGQVSSKYGQAKKSDFVLPGARWDDPNEWTMSILQNERMYGYLAEGISEVDGIVKYEIFFGAGGV
jgi:hypothetical protein